MFIDLWWNWWYSNVCMNKSMTIAYWLSQNNFHGRYVLPGTQGIDPWERDVGRGGSRISRCRGATLVGYVPTSNTGTFWWKHTCKNERIGPIWEGDMCLKFWFVDLPLVGQCLRCKSDLMHFLLCDCIKAAHVPNHLKVMAHTKFGWIHCWELKRDDSKPHRSSMMILLV